MNLIRFDLFRTMKKRKVKIKDNIYTSLFNFIATCVIPATVEFYLDNKLQKYTEDDKVVLNHYTHYNVMVKADGLHKFDDVFQIADLMRAKDIKIGTSTINSLTSISLMYTDTSHKNLAVDAKFIGKIIIDFFISLKK